MVWNVITVGMPSSRPHISPRRAMVATPWMWMTSGEIPLRTSILLEG